MVATRRVTVVTGPRQAGKTTLVQSQTGGGTLRSLDDQGTLNSALVDPVGFLALGPRPLVIDEVQRAGEPLARAVKLAVDHDPTPGQFVLTGSSNFLTVPTISESLAGRAGFIEVWLFTQGEISGKHDRFIECDVPVSGLLATATAAELVAGLDAAESVALTAEVDAWLDRRTPEQAAVELAGAIAELAEPSLPHPALAMLTDLGPELAVPQVRQLAENPASRGFALGWLADNGMLDEQAPCDSGDPDSFAQVLFQRLLMTEPAGMLGTSGASRRRRPTGPAGH